MRRTLTLIACLALSVVAPSAQAQQTSADTDQASPYTLKVTANLVSLDVVVTDAKGNPIDGLQRSDFSVFDNKTPQTILSFEAPETHANPAALAIDSTAELDRKAPDAPVSIIVLDEVNTEFADEAFARYAIKKYLATQPDQLTEPTELVAIDLRRFMVLHDYTTSKSAILDALNHHLQAYPWQLHSGWIAERFQQSFLALNQVAKAVAGHPGHKTMIWIGHGTPSLNLQNAAPEWLDAIQQVVDSTVNLLKDSRITLYTVDPSGVQVSPSGESDINGDPLDLDPFSSSITFNAMAQATGGLALFGRNDVDHLIGQAERDGNHFYTLTYRPSSDPTAQTFRAVHISVDRPGLKATTRVGYYDNTAHPPPPKTAKEELFEISGDLLAASQNQMVYDGLPITVRNEGDVPGKFSIHIPSDAVDWQHDTDPPTISLALLVATFDRRGHMLSRNARTLKLRGNSSDPALNLLTDVKLTDVHRVRIVLRNTANGKMGAQNIPCDNNVCTPTAP